MRVTNKRCVVANDLPELDRECFFIAPIGEEGSEERRRSDGVLKYIVSHAAEKLGLTAVRGDRIHEPGQINLQVINHVLEARAAVADLTGLNPNVFYELAVRHAARLPTALIAEKDCKIPFDIAQMRIIFFDHKDLESADQCRIKIVSYLQEGLEKGVVDNPIGTSIDVRKLQGGTDADRNVAKLVTTVQEISSLQRETHSLLERIRPYFRPSDLDQELSESLPFALLKLQEIVALASDETSKSAAREAIKRLVSIELKRQNQTVPRIHRRRGPEGPGSSSRKEPE
jgi:hypothetical protein